MHEYELHRLLGALLSGELTAFEKLNILSNEYDIPIEKNLRKDVSDMCNLSQGIEEKGIEKGILLSLKKLMSNLKLSLEQALDALEISEKDKPQYREMIKNLK